MQNFLNLNKNKTENIVSGNRTRLNGLTDTLGPLTYYFSFNVRNLGVF